MTKMVRLYLLALLAAGASVPALADSALVLVVSIDSPIREITALEIRKAYLGVRAESGSQQLRPVRLNGDKHLNEVFLQSVIAMSARSYERRLLSMTLKFGQPRPEQVASPEEVAAILVRSPDAIGYMWQADAIRDKRLRIVRVLWQQN